MKKILTLMTLLVAIVTGAWANQTDLIDGITLPDVPTSTLDVSDGGVTKDANGWYVMMSPKTNLTSSLAWYKGIGTNGGSDSYTIPTGTVAPYTSGEQTINRYTLQSGGRSHAIRFTGVEKASFLGNYNSDARKTHVSLFSYDGETQTLVETKSVGSGIGELVFDELSTSTNYIAYIYGNATSNSDFYGFALKAPPAKTIATQAYAGVKKGSTTLTEGTDFTKAENVITLASSYKTTVAPTDVKLINHITYTDSSTEDEDVDVTFGAASEGYFTGTKTIGLTTYTVKVPYDDTPTLVADATSLTVTSTKAATGTATFNLTGANLTGDNVTLSFASSVAGLTVSPTSIDITDGAVSQTVTVSYVSSEDVATSNINLTISTTGLENINIPVTYSSTAPVTELTPISAATTWDFSNLQANTSHPYYASSGIKLTDSTEPTKSADAWYIYDNYLGNFFTIKGGETFATESMAFYKSEYPIRDNTYSMTTGLKFKTTVPGTIVVKFSNTGDSRPYRYLLVNGVPTEFKTNTATAVTTTAIYVPAGEVTLTGAILDANDPQAKSGQDAGEQMIRISTVEFTPLAEAVPATVGASITACGYTTFSSIYPLDLSTLTEGMKAFVVTSAGGDDVTLTETTAKVPARTGLMIKGTADAPFTIETTSASTTTPATNLLVPVLSSTVVEKAAGGEKYANYVFGYSDPADPGFYLINATSATVGAGKAYLHTALAGGTPGSLGIKFEEITGVQNVVAAPQANEAQVGKKAFVNGQLVIITENGYVNALGQTVK